MNRPLPLRWARITVAHAMDEPTRDLPERAGARLTSLEELVMHFERMAQELNQVAIDHQRRIDAVEQQLKRLTSAVDGLSEPAVEPRSAEAEKPPHY